ncbi:O-sialoglycoprotein endopeptidase [Cryptococcus deuterogattii 99/473]|uniref:N(6)-L-threonylcarbamoyladenine synthase n=1 Tax=Cryptococcus deuterogattii Ram5 TaxID=1296110 RepID=A0A0D0V168_9TREE|nr:O-sialoglycoprotein endopeptidase [Cryptococcus deuterogattii Ram5]KIR71943.1 O-sialoglycoprotein endopeptidase [Cryptococcus deuterogattii CA1014]KIY54733.1 O-sialoglycoprotein endopeptidase [Cryptococcus deuterogattii 99/473]
MHPSRFMRSAVSNAKPISARIPLLYPKPLVVLAFESSADDSSASIVSCPSPASSLDPSIGTNHRLLSISTLSQHSLNSIYGGIHPLEAQVAHSTNIPRALTLCLQDAKQTHGLTWDDIDAVAYTRGPGMRGCLSVGEGAARGLAAGLGKNDVFEKSARLLSLPSSTLKAPAAVLEHYASLPPLAPYDTHPLPPNLLPIPLTTGKGKNILAWSFAGMLASFQTAIEQAKTKHCRREWAEPDRRAFAHLIQSALTTHLLTKLSQRIALLPSNVREQLGGIVISGGVASNAYIRSQLHEFVKRENGPFPAPNAPETKKIFYPPLHLCTDNAAMIAHTALIRLQTGLKSDPDNLKLRAKWSLEDMYDDVPEEAYSFKGAREINMGL